MKKINDKQSTKQATKEKIVNLFEDTGNFHDEEKLQKSYERVAENDKKMEV
jgi:hypothetical protein